MVTYSKEGALELAPELDVDDTTQALRRRTSPANSGGGCTSRS